MAQLTYPTMFDFEHQVTLNDWNCSWKSTCGFYESTIVNYLLYAVDRGSRVVTLLYSEGEYTIVFDHIYESKEEAMLQYLLSQYQDDLDVYEGDRLELKRVN